jgi:hypothetical protein
VDPTAGLDAVDKTKNFYPSQESNLSPQPVARRHADLVILVQRKRLMLHMTALVHKNIMHMPC